MLEDRAYTSDWRNVGINTEENFREFNKVWISGFFEDEFRYSHGIGCERFFENRVIVKRNSGNVDYVSVIVSEKLAFEIVNGYCKGKYVELFGQLRTYVSVDENRKRHIKLFLFAKTISVYDYQEELEYIENTNTIYLEGYLCKKPVYRITPMGREVCDVMLAVHRTTSKSDYIPCIAWAKNAQFASTFNTGDKIKLYGRVQSRDYFKRFSQDSEDGEIRTAYEVSIMNLAKT